MESKPSALGFRVDRRADGIGDFAAAPALLDDRDRRDSPQLDLARRLFLVQSSIDFFLSDVLNAEMSEETFDTHLSAGDAPMHPVHGLGERTFDVGKARLDGATRAARARRKGSGWRGAGVLIDRLASPEMVLA